jgi:hypothetical protein
MQVACFKTTTRRATRLTRRRSRLRAIVRGRCVGAICQPVGLHARFTGHLAGWSTRAPVLHVVYGLRVGVQHILLPKHSVGNVRALATLSIEHCKHCHLLTIGYYRRRHALLRLMHAAAACTSCYPSIRPPAAYGRSCVCIGSRVRSWTRWASALPRSHSSRSSFSDSCSWPARQASTLARSSCYLPVVSSLPSAAKGTLWHIARCCPRLTEQFAVRLVACSHIHMLALATDRPPLTCDCVRTSAACVVGAGGCSCRRLSPQRPA